MARRSITLALGIVMLMTLPGCGATEEERQRAKFAAGEAFARRVLNSGCVSGADISVDMQVLDGMVEAAEADAGWIEEGFLFVGGLDDLAASVDASFVTQAGREAWVLAERDGPRLLRLIEVGNALKPGFYVTETQRAC